MNVRSYFYCGLCSAAIASFSLLSAPAIAQRISNPSPSQGAVDVAPGAAISASFSELNGNSIQPDTLQIFVDDLEVTDEAVITTDFFTYRPTTNLSPGEHTIRLEFTNTSDRARQAQWSFTVGRETVAEIESVSHNGSDAEIARGETLLVTVNGTPQSRVTVFLVKDGSQLQSLTASEVSPGVYVASKTVGANDLAAEGIILARLERQEEVRFATAEQPLALVSEAEIDAEQVSVETVGEDEGRGNGNGRGNGRGGGRGNRDRSTPSTAALTPEALEPQVTSHQNGDRISGSSFTLAGTTAPNADVEISVVATNSLGGFIATERALIERTVQADADGNFSLSISSGPLSPSGTVYAVELTGEAGGITSRTTTLELIQN